MKKMIHSSPHFFRHYRHNHRQHLTPYGDRSWILARKFFLSMIGRVRAKQTAHHTPSQIAAAAAVGLKNTLLRAQTAMSPASSSRNCFSQEPWIHMVDWIKKSSEPHVQIKCVYEKRLSKVSKVGSLYHPSEKAITCI